MRREFRDLLKHGGIYGLAQIFGRITSLIMLPVYSSVLSTADYGCIAIVDLAVGIFTIVVSSGLSESILRHHFAAESEEEQSAIWWTGLLFIGVVSGLASWLVFLFNGPISAALLGEDYPNRSVLLALTIPVVWSGVLSGVLERYLRMRKWSVLLLLLSMGRLLLNIALNLTFLIGFEMGIRGLFLGNLITGLVALAAYLAIFAATETFVRLDFRCIGSLYRYGWPLAGASLLQCVMHQSDRYFIRYYASLSEVGTYSVAYMIAQGVNTMLLASFTGIYSIIRFELAESPDAKVTYGRIFQSYSQLVMLIMLAVSLFARPLLIVLTPPAFESAAQLIPILCLAFVFFSFHDHFKTAAVLSMRTHSMLIACAVGAAANLLLNCLLIWAFKSHGAAVASVLTYATYSFVGLALYQRIDPIDFRLRTTATVLGGMIASFLALTWLDPFPPISVGSIVLRSSVLLVWGYFLYAKLVVALLSAHEPALEALEVRGESHA